MTSIEEAATQAPSERRLRAVREGPVEWTCKVASEAALLVMLVLITVDIVTRSLFNFSFEVLDEVGGYMLVAISFLSLSTCHVNRSFHEVELVQARLTPRGRAVSHLIFGLLSLAACVLLVAVCTAGHVVRGGSATWRPPTSRRRSGCHNLRWRWA